MSALHVVFLDNFDSFTFNLVDEFARRGATVEVWRNDTEAGHVLARAEAAAGPALLVLSPGPGTPRRCGRPSGRWSPDAPGAPSPRTGSPAAARSGGAPAALPPRPPASTLHTLPADASHRPPSTARARCRRRRSPSCSAPGGPQTTGRRPPEAPDRVAIAPTQKSDAGDRGNELAHHRPARDDQRIAVAHPEIELRDARAEREANARERGDEPRLGQRLEVAIEGRARQLEARHQLVRQHGVVARLDEVDDLKHPLKAVGAFHSPIL